MSHQLTINKHRFIFEDVWFEIVTTMHDCPLEVSQAGNIWIHGTVILSVAHDDKVKFLRPI